MFGMVLAKQLTKCPFCLEPILAGARRCKHCQADLPVVKKRWSWTTRLNTFRTGFWTGLVFCAVVAALAWLQFR
jgi:hypothetical protein